MPGTLLKE